MGITLWILLAPRLLLNVLTLNERQISSAVSAVLRCENFSCADAAGAEQCGYGDLR
jgi:hypothetical protein